MTIRPSTDEEIKEAARKSKEKEQEQKDFMQAVREVFTMTDEEKVKFMREGRQY